MKNKVNEIDSNTIEFNGVRYKKEDSTGWIDIPELGLEVEIEVHDKGKSYDDLKLKDKEDQLLTIEQCIFLANSKYAVELKMDGSSSKDDFFIKQPFNKNREKGYVAVFYSYGYRSNFYCSRDSGVSYVDRGVRFCRKKIKESK